MTKDQSILQAVTTYRRDLHRIPERAFQEVQTREYIRRVLDPMHCEIEDIANTGLSAFFDFGCQETLCFRADMDALPIQEDSGLPFISEHPGFMHACGHDGHMANLLGLANVLEGYAEDLASGRDGFRPKYNALLLFQPAEETIQGALAIMESPILEKYRVAGIFGLHLWPSLKQGQVASCPGTLMARSCQVRIDISGQTAHAADPGKGRDALLAACRFVEAMDRYKETMIETPSVLKFGKLTSGTVLNAISEHTELLGTMRTIDEETLASLTGAMDAEARRIEEDLGVHFNIDTSHFHPAVINDEDLYRSLHSILSSDDQLNYEELDQPSMISEDFSFYQEKIPGVFFFLGTGTGIPLHSSDFNFDEKLLLSGVRLFDLIFRGL